MCRLVLRPASSWTALSLAIPVAFLLGAASAVRGMPKQTSIWDEDPLEKIAKLVVPHGYPLDVHNVQTDDGFILTLLRIPHGRIGRASAGTRSAPAAAADQSDAEGRESRAATRPVVFLQHGLLDSAAGFLVNGPGRSLAFLLADEGYDVWLGNVRGNTLSRTHAFLPSASARFWQWSYDEMAFYDMPAMMHHALHTSGASSLRYVGHSQGTTVILAALSGTAGAGRPPYGTDFSNTAIGASAGVVESSAADAAGGNVRDMGSVGPWLPKGLVERAVLLAPAAVAKHIASVPLLAMAALGTDDMFSVMGLHEFLPSEALVAALEGRLCAAQPHLCVSFLAALCGYNPDNLDNSRLTTYLSYTPAGTSVQNMAHWAQAVRSRVPNSWSYFDYGTNCASYSGRCNQLMYGSVTPPRYNLTAITTPLAIFSGSHDILATPMDVEYLREALGPGVVRLYKNLEAYEHLDFIWGIDAKEALYDDVLRFLATEDETLAASAASAAAAA